MARPIAATPVLTGKAATIFITKIHEDAKKPVGLVPTPKLEEARKLIKQYSEHGKKHKGGESMPTVYLKKELYDKLVKQGQDPSKVVNDLLEEKIRKEEKGGK